MTGSAALPTVHVIGMGEVGKRLEREVQYINEMFVKAATALEDDDDAFPEGHPVRFICEILRDIGDLQQHALEIGLHLVAKNTKVPRGEGAMDDMVRLASFEQLVLTRERERIATYITRIRRRRDSDKELEKIEGFLDLLGIKGEDAEKRPDSDDV